MRTLQTAKSQYQKTPSTCQQKEELPDADYKNAKLGNVEIYL